ncbi:hypothetical protein AB0B25_17265 [Nocardia sp. NPDC049190]|uniref:hypothetical protein n=1 Tax=Nocardia sp. NPDC049190 TaxID=3155650 RepID=UPI003410C136
MRANAIGLLRKDLAAAPHRDATTIHELANRVGYTLVKIFTPGDEIEPNPGNWLLAKVHRHRTAAVVIADQRHMNPALVDEITTVCSVVAPVQIFPGRVQYPEG